MPPIQITLSEPVPDLKCLTCGKEYKYDGLGDWGECLVLKDTRTIPPTIWGCWCDETCFTKWLKSSKAKKIFR